MTIGLVSGRTGQVYKLTSDDCDYRVEYEFTHTLSLHINPSLHVVCCQSGRCGYALSR